MHSRFNREKAIYVPVILFIFLTLTVLVALNGCKLNPYTCENTPEEYQNLEETTYFLYVLWRDKDESLSSFEERVFEDIVPEIMHHVMKLTVMIENQSIKSMSLIPRKREDGARLAAIISVMVDNREEAEALTDIIYPEVNFLAGYEVAQAIPRDYEKTWEDGVASPGVKQVTLLQQKQDLEYDEFRDYWFCSHTPLALEINPIWRYERNEVMEAITPDAPAYNGIVGLHFEYETDLTDLKTFFGGKIIINSSRIGADILNFINMKTIEVRAMTEYIIKS